MDARQTATNLGLRRAFEARNRLSIARSDPVNVFDACQAVGIDIRFVDCKTLEGMYCRAPHLTIILPSSLHRPRGRVVFTCGHEFGHHELGHGTHVDKYVAGSTERATRDPEEIAADVFAAHFLMPRQAVVQALRARGWEVSELTPKQVMSLASMFGVGYETILWQLRAGLQLLPDFLFQKLLKVSPKSIRGECWEDSESSHLVIWDRCWGTIPVDLEVGDYLATPPDASINANCLRPVGNSSGSSLWLAESVGHAKLTCQDVATHVRVARSGYVGSWRHRFMTEVKE